MTFHNTYFLAKVLAPGKGVYVDPSLLHPWNLVTRRVVERREYTLY